MNLKKLELKLISDWKKTLRHAWSVRFNVIAAVAGTLEMLAQSGKLDVPLWVFLSITIVSSLAAGGSRVVAQKELSDGNGTEE